MITRALLAVFMALALSGCVVQSLNPFYTQDLVVDMPAEIKGQWLFVVEGEEVGKDKAGSARLIFTKDGLIYHEETNVYNIDTVFFKIGDQLFIDLVLNGSMGSVASLLLFHPHNLVRVVLKDGGMELQWADYLKMKELASEQKVKMFVDQKGMFIILAESNDVVQFLRKIKDDPELFSSKSFLKRSAK